MQKTSLLVFILLSVGYSFGQKQGYPQVVDHKDSATQYFKVSMNFEQGVSHLTTKFTEMLNLAEEIFGERDKSWTYIGIEFHNDGPYIMYYKNKKNSIVLSTTSSNLIPTHPQLYFQLAHEVCHLLYPTGKKDSNVLNEGISAYFSKLCQEILFPQSDYAIRSIEKSKYYRAYFLVNKLISSDQNAIKKIRAVNPNISHGTKEEIKSLNFVLSDDDIEELLSTFDHK